MCISNKGHRWIHEKLCFGDGDVFVDITLLNNLAVNNMSIYNARCPVVKREKTLPKFTKFMKIVKIDYKGHYFLRGQLTILLMLTC